MGDCVCAARYSQENSGLGLLQITNTIVVCGHVNLTINISQLEEVETCIYRMEEQHMYPG